MYKINLYSTVTKSVEVFVDTDNKEDVEEAVKKMGGFDHLVRQHGVTEEETESEWEWGGDFQEAEEEEDENSGFPLILNEEEEEEDDDNN